MTRLLLAIAIVVLACISNAPERETIGLAVGTRAPIVKIGTVSGDTLDLADYIGRQPVVVQFWATWCGSCDRLEAAVRTAHERYGRDVAFITIAVPPPDSPERARRYAERQGLPGVIAFDAQGAAVRAFRAPVPSYVVVIDRSGTIVYTGVGSRQDIAAELTTLVLASP